MRTHNVCFCGEKKKISGYPLLSGAVQTSISEVISAKVYFNSRMQQLLVVQINEILRKKILLTVFLHQKVSCGYSNELPR